MPVLSVIVVNWNAGPALMDCLAALFGSDVPPGGLEVLLVDNGSTDGSQRPAAREYPAIALIENRGNHGFAAAVNQALGQARGEFLLLLNPDVLVEPGALALLVDFMTTHPEVGIVGPRLLNADGTVQGSARRDPSPWTGLFGRTAPLTRLFPNNPLSRRELPGLGHHGDAPLEVDWISGACLLARRAAHARVGGLDERFFLFWEDADWCLRFRAAGWRVVYLPTARAIHHVGVSRAHRPIRSALDFHRSAYRFYRKHRLGSPFHPLTPLLVAGLALHLGWGVVQALTGSPRR